MKNLIGFLFINLLFLFNTCFADAAEDTNKQICESNKVDMQKAQTFLDEFNKLVQSDDKNAIVKLIDYPVKINKEKKSGKTSHYEIKTEKAFLDQYASLFTQSAKEQLDKRHSVDCDPQGYVSTAGGNYYFNYHDGNLKIAIINAA